MVSKEGSIQAQKMRIELKNRKSLPKELKNKKINGRASHQDRNKQRFKTSNTRLSQRSFNK